MTDLFVRDNWIMKRDVYKRQAYTLAGAAVGALAGYFGSMFFLG